MSAHTQSKAASRLGFTTTAVCFVEELTDVCLLSSLTKQDREIQKTAKKKKKKAKDSVEYKLNQNSSTAKQTKMQQNAVKSSAGGRAHRTERYLQANISHTAQASSG